jgi:hypothetical protein
MGVQMDFKKLVDKVSPIFFFSILFFLVVLTLIFLGIEWIRLDG